ncbi:MAG: prepilin-type N-terminal cleavage/methylation domain-containing protein [Thermodesulfobacteriota bacterium]|nr:prepilin-type N-terminal cleavage/methylation domain-containing protein [Thermodesulfobacteriota bacterium]
MRPFLKRSQGFTLIEIMAVLVIMGVMASVAARKINDISGTAELRALETGIVELNAREMLYWTNAKFAPGGWGGNGGDTGVWAVMALDTDVGTEYSWTVGPDRLAGGTLSFGSQSIPLNRAVSTNIAAARWSS